MAVKLTGCLTALRRVYELVRSLSNGQGQAALMRA